MSKGQIVRNDGEGRYLVSQKFASGDINDELEKLNNKIAKLAVSLPTKKIELLQSESATNAKARDIDLAIPAFQAGDDGAREVIARLQVDLIKLQSETAMLRRSVSEFIAENLSTLKQRNKLENVPKERDVEAWCADYTEDLSGSVGLVDINDEGGNGVLIQPGFQGAAKYDHGRDGDLFPNLVQSGPQIFFNAAILPGVQKWMPRYRKGKILAIEGDLCTMELETAKSSAQGLNINQDTVLHEVPIQYMDCNAGAFEVGDKVLVRYFSSGPQVVGFTSNPKPCAIDMVWRSIEQSPTRPNSYSSIGRKAKIGVKPLDIEFNYQRRDAICLYGNRKYILDNRFNVVFGVASFPSTWLIQDLAVFNNAVSGRKEVWVIGSERQQVGGNYDPDDEEWVKVRIFNEVGGIIEDRVLLTPPAYVGNTVSIVASPHYYAFTSAYVSQVRSTADDSVVMDVPWADAWPPHNAHNRTSALDITDELVVWTDHQSVYCRLLPSGAMISAVVDLPYLQETSTGYNSFGDPTYTEWGILAVQLSNRTLTVFGAKNLIHYRITSNNEGIPNGFREISRHQFSEQINLNIYASSDRSLLASIPP